VQGTEIKKGCEFFSMPCLRLISCNELYTLWFKKIPSRGGGISFKQTMRLIHGYDKQGLNFSAFFEDF
jgi:hypothetical protein